MIKIDLLRLELFGVFLTTFNPLMEPHTLLRFRCTDPKRTYRQTSYESMSLEDAIAYCAYYKMLVKTSDATINATDSTPPELLVRYWTGSRRHNLTHFKREDGLLFEPAGIAGTWRGFPSRIWVFFKNLQNKNFSYVVNYLVN